MNLTPVALMEGSYFAVCILLFSFNTYLLNHCFFPINISNISPNFDATSFILFYFIFPIYLQNTVFGGEPTKPDYNYVPYAVFW